MNKFNSVQFVRCERALTIARQMDKPTLGYLSFRELKTLLSSVYTSMISALETGYITGSAVALHWCKAHSKINRKMANLTPCKIVTPENFILKLGTRDYVDKVTYYTIFDVDRFSGASPHIGEI